jgi:ATP phosphoribosyltransferase
MKSALALRIGLPKGRLLDQLRPLFGKAGLDLSSVDEGTRRLIHPLSVPGIGDFEVLLLRPADVAVYVENGVCAFGVVGSDVLLEQRPDVLAPLDLGVGRCRICLAGRADLDPYALETPTIATKYPRIAAEHFHGRGTSANIIELSGNVEIAPLVGLADAIVDIVETGETLAKNGLIVRDELEVVSGRLIQNRAAQKLKAQMLRSIEERLRAVATP